MVSRLFGLAFLLALAGCAQAESNSAIITGECSKHPASKEIPGLKGVLVKNWKVTDDKYGPSFYVPRSPLSYVPVDEPSSSQFKNLDFLFIPIYNLNGAADGLVKFTRQARVYMALPATYDRLGVGSLDGWKSHGWIESTTGADQTVEYGLRQKKSHTIPQRMYVFSRMSSMVDGNHQLPIPGQDYVNSVKGIQTRSKYYILVSEADGSASVAPQSPAGVGEIPVNGRCPEELHSMWKAPGDDADDPQTYERMFETWHPIVDPCYWCGYDHDHGADAGTLLGYPSLYDYAALKNYIQDESHKGFKSIVFEEKGYMIGFDIHAHVSQASRLFTRFHSGALTIVEKATGRLMVRLTQKLDYGVLRVRTGRDEVMELVRPEEEQAVYEEMEGLTSRGRVINILNGHDKSRIDPKYTYAEPFTLGRYEKWNTVFMCMPDHWQQKLLVDFVRPATALKTPRSPNDSSGITQLGVMEDGVFQPNTGLTRNFAYQDFEVSMKHCAFEDVSRDGVWYTDPRGYYSHTEPDRQRMKQYIRPGFSLKLPGHFRFEVPDRETMLHVKEADNAKTPFFEKDFIDPAEN